MSIESTILTWLNDVSGLDVWQAPIDTAKDKPDGEYLTFSVLSITTSDFNQRDVAAKDSDFITKTIRNNAVITLSVNAFAYQGYDIINKIGASGDFWQHRNTLKAGGLNVGKMGNPQNLTGLGDTNYVSRWQADIELNFTTENADDWHRLKEIQLAGQFLNVDGSGVIDSLIKWPII